MTLSGCAVGGCSQRIEARGWCGPHYQRWRRYGDPTGARVHEAEWKPHELASLRSFYKGRNPKAAEVRQFAELIGRTSMGVQNKATKLKIRSSRAIPDVVCPSCGIIFHPRKRRVQFCSTLCGNKGKWDRNTHPRGSLGMRHTDEVKDLIRTQVTERMKDPASRAVALAGLEKGLATRLRGGVGESNFTRGHGGRRSDLGDQYFRSSWEANYARYLNLLVKSKKIASWEFEPQTFEFPVKRGNRFYTPDFKVWKNDGTYEWHEVKGWMTDQSRVKLARFAKYYPDERLVLIDSSVYNGIAHMAKRIISGWE